MLIKNIIWDWNGTIVDDAWVFVEVMNKTLKKNNLPPTSLNHYRENFCFPIQDYWKCLGFSFTKENFNKLNAEFIKEYQKKMFLPSIHRGLRSFFLTLQNNNFSQFILSASENSLLQRSVNYYKITSFFQGIYGVDNLNALGKESLGKKICLKHSLVPTQTLLIGDTEYDALVADSLGCPVVLVSHGHIDHQRLLQTGKVVVSSIKEISKYLGINQ